jgi:hypothetical protein
LILIGYESEIKAPLLNPLPLPFGERGERGGDISNIFLIGFGDFFIVFTNSADSDMGLCV